MSKIYAKFVVVKNEINREELESAFNKSRANADMIKKAANSLELGISESSLDMIASVYRAFTTEQSSIKIKENERFYIIDDCEISFETIEEEAARISSIITARVFFVSVFEDDILVSGIYDNGELLFIYREGECDTYDMERTLSGEHHYFEFFPMIVNKGVFSSWKDFEALTMLNMNRKA